MSRAIQVLHSMVERKPKHGEPCNGCGVCCVGSLCQVAQAVFHRPFAPGPCPAMLFNDDGWVLCGIALDPRPFNLAAPESDMELTASALVLIGGGYGCDARINGEAVNAEFNQRLDRRDRVLACDIAAAKRIWNVR